MGDLGDLLGLGPAPTRRPRARTRCRDCSRPVYVDQLVYGLGRCCAEKAGLLVHRYRLTGAPQAGETLLDHLPKEDHAVDPYPQIRINVARLGPDIAHAAIVEHTRSMIADPSGELAAVYPSGVTAATDDAFRGLLAILKRHAPGLQTTVRLCGHAPHTEALDAWPCDDYRDACRGLATGLPDTPGTRGTDPEHAIAEEHALTARPRELAEQTGPRTDDGDAPHAGAISAL